MKTTEKTLITVETKVNTPVEKVWNIWTTPEHIVNWNTASEDWHTTKAENDLRAGGKFHFRMEAREEDDGFDFDGVYDKVNEHKEIGYTLGDGRNVQVFFTPVGNGTIVKEVFEAEKTNPVEVQESGWQSILDNFKEYLEGLGKKETLHFEIIIDAPPEKVYNTMIDEKLYQEWTSEFSPGSHFIGSWDKGSKVLFLGPDKDGNQSGMVSFIKENIPNKFISIEHIGFVENGKEITSGPAVEDWAGAMENYTFFSEGESTLLEVDMDTNKEFKQMFDNSWPAALKKLKDICERNN
jgi:uncharacterized protein YndB with AHSA1/START domain